MSFLAFKLSIGHYPKKNRATLVLALVVLFLVIFDNLVQYLRPLLIFNQGYSATMVGLIISASSLTGMLFDFLAVRLFQNINYRRIFLVLFAICLFVPLLLWEAKLLWFWLFFSAVIGIYFDLLDFAIFDFVARHTPKKEHVNNFGIIQIFKSLAGILSPLIVAAVIINTIDWRPFALAWIFLAIAFIFFIVLLVLAGRPAENIEGHHLKKRNAWLELRLWKIVAEQLWPALLITFFSFVLDAFFWTLAPLYGEMNHNAYFGGLLLTAYAVPALFLGWFVGRVTKKFGEKKTAFLSLLLGSLILSIFNYLPKDFMVLLAVFFSSCFTSVALPAINGAYADYISEAPFVEGEIECLENFSFNLGYLLGPILAGLLVDLLDVKSAFSVLGLIGVLVSLFLLQTATRSNNLKIPKQSLE